MRVQRKRVKGWKMPPNTVYVGRPTVCGNPFEIGKDGRNEVLRKYREWLKDRLEENPEFLEPLRGKNLACWCPLDQPCHVDILLEFLNS